MSQHCKKHIVFKQITKWSLWRWCNKHRNMYEVIGNKYMYLTHYVHWDGIKEATDCKNARSEKLQHQLVTYSMVQSPSWEANWFAVSQEIPRISRNPKVHYRTRKRRPPVPILGQPNPVHIPTSHLLEIHPNIIHSFTPRSPQWSPSLLFPQQYPIHPLPSQ